jgi:hypothetical protein
MRGEERLVDLQVKYTLAPLVADSIKLEDRLEYAIRWDHCVFIPLLLLYRAADIPIIQFSILSSEDPHQHVPMGPCPLFPRQTFLCFDLVFLLSQSAYMFGSATSTPDFKALNDEWSKIPY